MIDDVRLTFAALREAGPVTPEDLAVRALPDAPRGALLGLDGRGRPHLLIDVDETQELLDAGHAAIGCRSRVAGDLR